MRLLGRELMRLGSYFPWRATAIGRNASSAKQFLEKRYNPEMELEDAIHTALLTLKEGFEGEMTADTVEIGLPLHPFLSSIVCLFGN
jgi:20S proteasome subunit alpha 2